MTSKQLIPLSPTLFGQNKPSKATDSAPAQPPAKATKELDAETQTAHRIACERGEPMYEDPKSGFMVMTATFLEGRGYCCQSGCRHCPFGFTGPSSVSH